MAKVRAPLHSIGLRGRMADGFVFTVWRGNDCTGARGNGSLIIWHFQKRKRADP